VIGRLIYCESQSISHHCRKATTVIVNTAAKVLGVIHSFIHSSMALQDLRWTLVAFFFQFHNPIHSRGDSLDGGSARRKSATYTQDNTNRIKAQTSMPQVGSEYMTPVYERAKTVLGVIPVTNNYLEQSPS
jgi:peptide methionine sulfoxide reductase MsrA